MSTPAALTAGELMTRLRRHYLKPGPLPGGVFIPEVGINGGLQSRCDAVFIGFTSTSGRMLIGHEVKTSRGDWLHELDQPGKADFWHDACHAWYVVAPGVDIVKPAELPHGWGLLTVNPRTATRLDVTTRAAHRDETHNPPWLAVRSIIARTDTLRATEEMAFRNQLEQRLRAELPARVAEETKLGKPRAERMVEAVIGALTAEQYLNVGLIDVDDVVTALTDLAQIKRTTRTMHSNLQHVISDTAWITRALTEAADKAKQVRLDLPLDT